MTKSDFHDDASFRSQAEAYFSHLLEQLDEIEFDEFDPRHTPGSLTLQFDDGSVVMLSRQTPTHELWLSANYTAWHFLREDGIWKERDTQEAMLEVLNHILSEKMNEKIELV